MVVVESDKADMDVETFYDGILAAIVVGEGEVRQNNVVTHISLPCQNDGDASIRGRCTALGFPAFHMGLVEICRGAAFGTLWRIRNLHSL